MKGPSINWDRQDDDYKLMQRGVSPRIKWLAAGFTLLACLFFLGLYFLIPEYRHMLGERIKELPIFTRIVLNIYQTFLVVFILISIALMVVFQLKIKRPGSSYKALLILIAVNFIFAGVLFWVTFTGIN